MLSSMPLTFNVLGPMALDLGLATAVWRHLLPTFVDSVTATLDVSVQISAAHETCRALAPGTCKRKDR